MIVGIMFLISVSENMFKVSSHEKILARIGEVVLEVRFPELQIRNSELST